MWHFFYPIPILDRDGGNAMVLPLVQYSSLQKKGVRAEVREGVREIKVCSFKENFVRHLSMHASLIHD